MTCGRNPVGGPQRLACALAIFGCAWLGWMGIRTWRASTDTAAAQVLALGQGSEFALPYLARAVRYRPDEAKAWRLLAQFRAFAHPRQALFDARKAVAVDPDDWRNWNQLGLIQFQLNHLAAAQWALGQAVRRDSGWMAHYQLGNLALLLGNKREFWAQLRAALAVVVAWQAEPLLQEAVRISANHPRQMLAALPPGRADVDARAVRLLMRRGRPLDAAAVWERMQCQSFQRADCRSAVLALTNGLMLAAFRRPAGASASDSQAGTPRSAQPAPGAQAQLVPAAIRAWNQGIRRQVMDAAQARVSAASDGLFQRQWTGPAFAWTQTGPVYLSREPGVAPVGNAVRINFDGYEPDATTLLQQLVAVAPGAQYEVSYWARREGDGSQTGVELQVLVSPGEVLLRLPARLATGWQPSRAVFQTPRHTHVVLLAFVYRRPEGQVRLANPVLVADVRLGEVER